MERGIGREPVAPASLLQRLRTLLERVSGALSTYRTGWAYGAGVLESLPLMAGEVRVQGLVGLEVSRVPVAHPVIRRVPRWWRDQGPLGGWRLVALEESCESISIACSNMGSPHQRCFCGGFIPSL